MRADCTPQGFRNIVPSTTPPPEKTTGARPGDGVKRVPGTFRHYFHARPRTRHLKKELCPALARALWAREKRRAGATTPREGRR